MNPPRLLVLCFPTWGAKNELHTNSTSEWIVLAPDEMIRLLRADGIHVDVVSLTDRPVHLPLMRSKILPVTPDQVGFDSYDAFWHMFRDPTQPEVLERLASLPLPTDRRVFNAAEALQQLTKWEYLPRLTAAGIGPQIIQEVPPEYAMNSAWEPTNHSARVSRDRKLVQLYATNNNRGDYPERRDRERVTVEYVDNEAGGVRSFFRIGYACGQVTEGWLYCRDATETVLKSGTCKHQIPFALPTEYHTPLSQVMAELNVDIAHIEGLFRKDRLYVFDINPYPTAHGGTLTRVTAGIVGVIASELNHR